MRILLVAATSPEIAPVIAAFGDPSPHSPRLNRYTFAAHQVDVLVTGVGMVATAAWCSRALAHTPYDLGLNFGVCGSFDRALEPGTVVQVVSDRIAELGAEDDYAFLTIQDLNLLGDDEFPFVGGELVNAAPQVNPALTGLPAVHGITVNTVHGDERSIAEVTRRFAPQVESMEGAAFMYACLIHGVAFAQVRAVSNVVEKRNRDAWKLPEAISSLSRTALSVLEHA
jgi:futalosine hydrolase